MEQNDKNLIKVLILLSVSALLLASAVLEKYASNLTGYIITFFAAVMAGCIITAFTISVTHLIGLLLFGFVIGFLTQAVGVTSDLWCYDNHTFIFAAISWALASVTMEGISKIIRSKLKSLTDHPLNVLMIFALLGALVVTLASQDYWKYAKYRPTPPAIWPKNQESGNQRPCFINEELPKKGSEPVKLKLEPNEPFWIYYISLAGFAILMQARIPFTELLSLILAAWIMGGISEWIGATAKLWHFRTTAPPLFLVFGCWPLEFLVIRGLATRMKTQPSFDNR